MKKLIKKWEILSIKAMELNLISPYSKEHIEVLKKLWKIQNKIAIKTPINKPK